jgi:hypothetical protein
MESLSPDLCAFGTTNPGNAWASMGQHEWATGSCAGVGEADPFAGGSIYFLPQGARNLL